MAQRTARGKLVTGPRRSACPIACTLDLIGDRWTLLVIRDLMLGKRRFSEFLQSGESIPTNILTERLKRLESAGLIARAPYQDNPPRSAYALTAAGESLAPVIRAIYDWGLGAIPGTKRRAKQAARSSGKETGRKVKKKKSGLPTPLPARNRSQSPSRRAR
jgi:DNA-binding HxlR family transcriptional regulator